MSSKIVSAVAAISRLALTTLGAPVFTIRFNIILTLTS